VDQRAARRYATEHVSECVAAIAESFESDGTEHSARFSPADRERLRIAYAAIAAELYGRYHRESRTDPIENDPNQIALFEEVKAREIQA
jgi:hypothetical protein